MSAAMAPRSDFQDLRSKDLNMAPAEAINLIQSTASAQKPVVFQQIVMIVSEPSVDTAELRDYYLTS